MRSVASSSSSIPEIIELTVRNTPILRIIAIAPDIMARWAESESACGGYKSQPDADTQNYLPNRHVMKAPCNV